MDIMLRYLFILRRLFFGISTLLKIILKFDKNITKLSKNN